MAPRETPKATPKVQRTIVKTASKLRSTPTSTVKKTMSTKKTGDKIPLKVSNMTEVNIRQRTSTVPKVSTPKPKENKSVPLPGSVVKSAKKATWKRRPKPAHSGVPVPEKMKRLFEKQLQDADCSL
ncbi:uncharacterized protein LOC128671451 [Plodia interpunctella]|uniref:uncharacterized protein LOC128671451 n=1 Tax=Plodia interpunctella TaxID=58824 RepID=UPI002368B7CB|nr:uncharacterized protein LOC128671451 [Plodia interpunctella]